MHYEQTLKYNHTFGFPKIGLALSGGASRGIAHLGVLKAFEKAGIPIHFVSGNSIGALVGSFYAFGVPLDCLLKHAKSMSWASVSALQFSKKGLLSNRAIGKIVQKYLGNATIEDSPLPLAILTTDIQTGESVILRDGSLTKAVMASCCLPGIFKPVEIDGRLLVDGFVVDNLGITPLRDMGADIVIAINLSARRDYRKPDNALNIFLNTCEISIDLSTSFLQKAADILINPDFTAIPGNDANWADKYFDEGYKAAYHKIEEIRELYNRTSFRTPGLIIKNEKIVAENRYQQFAAV